MQDSILLLANKESHENKRKEQAFNLHFKLPKPLK
jgi:hypothetical protein